MALGSRNISWAALHLIVHVILFTSQPMAHVVLIGGRGHGAIFWHDPKHGTTQHEISWAVPTRYEREGCAVLRFLKVSDFDKKKTKKLWRCE